MSDTRNTSMSYRNKEAWTWCDALFMAPPLYARMSVLKNDTRYFEFMDKEFRKTYDYLFDKTEETTAISTRRKPTAKRYFGAEVTAGQ